MKAEIKIDGTLKIQAETELEGYALQMWVDKNWNPSCSRSITTENIELSWNIEKPDIKKRMLDIYHKWLQLDIPLAFDIYVENYK